MRRILSEMVIQIGDEEIRTDSGFIDPAGPEGKKLYDFLKKHHQDNEGEERIVIGVPDAMDQSVVIPPENVAPADDSPFIQQDEHDEEHEEDHEHEEGEDKEDEEDEDEHEEGKEKGKGKPAFLEAKKRNKSKVIGKKYKDIHKIANCISEDINEIPDVGADEHDQAEYGYVVQWNNAGGFEVVRSDGEELTPDDYSNEKFRDCVVQCYKKMAERQDEKEDGESDVTSQGEHHESDELEVPSAVRPGPRV